MAVDEEIMKQWIEDCAKYRDKTLTGKYWHWCSEWDDLPMDETCLEWPCGCSVVKRLKEKKNGKS